MRMIIYWTDDKYAWDMTNYVKIKKRWTMEKNRQTLTNDGLC